MSSEEKETGEPETETFDQEGEIDRIEFILDETKKAAVPFLSAESGKPLAVPSVAHDSAYDSLPEKNPFQAHLPKLSTRDEYASNADNLKWCGARIWPRNEPIQEPNTSSIQEGSSEPTNKVIGNGRSPDATCKCESRGWVNCVHRHVKEEREKLKAELGPAFQSWKFDEMGEDVGDSWTLKEARRFIYVIKTRNCRSSGGRSFVELAKQYLPNKSGESIVSYYFNVYLPCYRNRKRIGWGCSAAEIDTDDDDGPLKKPRNWMQKFNGAGSGVRVPSRTNGLLRYYLNGCR